MHFDRTVIRGHDELKIKQITHSIINLASELLIIFFVLFEDPKAGVQHMTKYQI